MSDLEGHVLVAVRVLVQRAHILTQLQRTKSAEPDYYISGPPHFIDLHDWCPEGRARQPMPAVAHVKDSTAHSSQVNGTRYYLQSMILDTILSL